MRNTERMEPTQITIRGAREHNLANVSLDLPRNRLICFTGVSGSGKSSLAFDTLYAEGQRRYIESLSSYARQFLGQVARPEVDQITGLSPSISIQQKTSGWNPRSTVGTITQIYDYLRVLFARIGQQHCTKCGRAITAQSREQIITRILALPAGTRFLVLAPVVRGQKGEHRDLCDDLRRQGYARARVDGQVVSLSDDLKLGRNMRHDIEVVVDRLVMNDTVRPRLAEAVDNALQVGKGTLIVQPVEEESSSDTKHLSPRLAATRRGASKPRATTKRSTEPRTRPGDILLSSHHACLHCDVSFDPLSPQLFSFNSPTGMCLECDGLGTTYDFDLDLLIPDDSLSLLGGAIQPLHTPVGKWRRHIYAGVAKHVGFDLNTAWRRLPAKARDALLYGTGDDHVTFEWRWPGGTWRHGGTFDGILEQLHEKHRNAKRDFIRRYHEQFMRSQSCTACRGARLNPQALAVRLPNNGPTIHDACGMSIAEACHLFENLALNKVQQTIAEEVLKEIRGRLKFLTDVGLHYLALHRRAPTLSGGESQRIRLAGQIGAGLVGVLYILDEPSIGLHPRDNRRLLDSLERLRDMGNTVIVVEHDEETMRAADTIVDFGPGPGVRGGEVVETGSISKITRNKNSITGQYLSGKKRIEIPTQRRPVGKPPRTNKRRRATKGKKGYKVRSEKREVRSEK